MLWVLLLDGFSCADYGVLALDSVGGTSALAAATCVGVFLAFDRLLASISLLPLAWERTGEMRVHPTYVPPDVLILLWNVFTAMSIILVASTARSTLSIAFKTLHVAVEASMLIFVLWHHQLRGLAGAVASSVGVIGVMVLLYPCEVSIDWAETAGLVLDSVNFLIHLVVYRSQRDNAELRLTVRGLGLHAVYLVLYLVVNDLHRFVELHLSTPVRALLRVAGMLLNLVATYVFLHLERLRLLPPPGSMTVAEWRASGRPGRALWVSPTEVLLEGAAEGQLVPLHRPYETAYAGASARPLLPHAARLVDDRVVTYVCVWPWASVSLPTLPTDGTRVTVRSALRRDVLGAIASVVAGLVVWSL